MKRILFVCHGNICRSPMAELVLRDMLKRTGNEDRIYVESAATSTEELGNPVYPPARAELLRHGISCEGKTARQVNLFDLWNFDLFVAMDGANVRNLVRMLGEGARDRIVKLLDLTDRPGDVADPWYSGDFSLCYRDVYRGCQALLEQLTST